MIGRISAFEYQVVGGFVLADPKTWCAGNKLPIQTTQLGTTSGRGLQRSMEAPKNRRNFVIVARNSVGKDNVGTGPYTRSAHGRQTTHFWGLTSFDPREITRGDAGRAPT